MRDPCSLTDQSIASCPVSRYPAFGSTMTKRFRKAALLAFAGYVALSAISASPANAEVRIGFLAPTTGIFAQVGKDMVDGFKMYLDEHKHKLGGADVTFIV